MNKVKIVQRGAGRFDWEPCSSKGTMNDTVRIVREFGIEALPDWFPYADLACSFTREQIDLLAAVLRLNGIEVIER